MADKHRTSDPQTWWSSSELRLDDIRFSAADVLWIHEHTGVRLIFDHQHFWCLNPERLEMVDTIRRVLATWPSTTRPKLHYSSPRTELRAIKRRDKETKRLKTVHLPPIWTGHATNPFEFARFMRDCEELVFDVMLESKRHQPYEAQARLAPLCAGRGRPLWHLPERCCSPEADEVRLEADTDTTLDDAA